MSSQNSMQIIYIHTQAIRKVAFVKRDSSRNSQSDKSHTKLGARMYNKEDLIASGNSRTAPFILGAPITVRSLSSCIKNTDLEAFALDIIQT